MNNDCADIFEKKKKKEKNKKRKEKIKNKERRNKHDGEFIRCNSSKV